MKKAKKVKPVFAVLTAEQRKSIQACMQRCWQTIGSDVLACQENPNLSIPKVEVVDVVIDQMEGNGGMPPDLAKLWNTLPFEQMQEIANETFKFERYGY